MIAIVLIIGIWFAYPLIKCLFCVGCWGFQALHERKDLEENDQEIKEPVYAVPTCKKNAKKCRSVRSWMDAHKDMLTADCTFPIGDMPGEEDFIEELIEALMLYGYTYVWYDEKSDCVKAHEGGTKR